MSLEMLKESLQEASIIKKGNYYYVIHSITDGIPKVEPKLLHEVTNEMQKRIERCGRIDKIVTIEAMGIPLAAVLSQKMNLPFTIIRKRAYNLPDEVSVDQITGYSKSRLYINGLERGDSVVIVDDVLSTGGTLRAVLKAFEKMDVAVKGVFIVINKGDIAEKVMGESKVTIDTLVDIEIIDGNKVIIKS